MASTPESYDCPLNGQPILRIGGRLNRLQLPLPADPPRDDRDRCFFCKPENDRYDEGAWADELHVLGNAHPVGQRSLLLFPPGPGFHEARFSQLPARTVDCLFRAVVDGQFQRHFGLTDLAVCAFFNVGRPAGQSRRHLHMQLVGTSPEVAKALSGRPEEVAEDLAAAAAEGRVILVEDGPDLPIVLPRHPGMTAEVWLPLPGEEERRPWVEVLLRAVAACEVGISPSFNLALRPDLNLLRIVPRGLSERAGLELSLPTPIDAVVGATLEETRHLWTSAMQGS